MEIAPALVAYRHVRAHRFTDAIAVYDDIIATSPERPEIWINRGVSLQAVGRLEDAIKSFDAAIAIQENHAGAHINRGVALGWLSRNREALESYNRAIEIEPDNEAGRMGRSVILSSLHRFDEALEDTNYVLERNQGSGAAHYNKSLLLLSMGDYAEGFREHEWRFGTNSILGRYQFTCPMWAGERTKKRIFVHSEQGLGDQIQFARYIPIMRDMGLNVLLESPPSLVKLFKQFNVEVNSKDQWSPEYDLHCPLMSLGPIFETTLDTVPSTSSYLNAYESDVVEWWKKLRHLPHPRVGLAWNSGVRPGQIITETMQRRKSIPTSEISALLDVPGISFVSLQKDIPDGGIPDRLYNPMDHVNDLADTAGIIANLDLVITVDSAVAHLAGAMGKPVWVLNRADICWRWLSGHKESPWYDSAKIYRQKEPFEWTEVLMQVKSDLTKSMNTIKQKAA